MKKIHQTSELFTHESYLSIQNNILKYQSKTKYLSKPYRMVFHYQYFQFQLIDIFIYQYYEQLSLINLFYLKLSFLNIILFQKHFWLQLLLCLNPLWKLFGHHKLLLHLMDQLLKMFLLFQNQPICYLSTAILEFGCIFLEYFQQNFIF